MSWRALGGNRADGVVLVVACLALAGGLAPGALDASGPPVLERASVHGNTLSLTFTADVAPRGTTWVSFVDVTLNGVAVRTPEGRHVGGGDVEVVLPGGAFAGDVVEVRVREGAPLVPEGAPASGPVRATAEATRTGMPSERHFTHPVFVDGAGYVFGGHAAPAGARGITDQIVRYDPDTGEARILDVRLPRPLWRHDVAVDPRPTEACPVGCAYVFGGVTYGSVTGEWGQSENGVESHEILRFDPTGPTVTAMRAELPAPTPEVAVAFTGSTFVIIGGWSTTAESGHAWNGVRVYDPWEDVVEVLPARLPWGVAAADAFFDARSTPTCPVGCAYALFGHTTSAVYREGFAPPSEAIRFEPLSGTIVPVGNATGQQWGEGFLTASLGWTGEFAYIPGAAPGGAWYRFDPLTASWSTYRPPEEAAVVAGLPAGHGRDVWLFGVANPGLPEADRGIVRVTPS